MACRRDPRLLLSAIEVIVPHRIRTMLLEMLLGGSHELDSNELVAVNLLAEASTYILSTYPRVSNREMMGPMRPRYNQLVYHAQSYSVIIIAYLDAIRLDRNEAIHKCQLHRQIAR